MTTAVIDVTQAARDMIQMWQDVRESGLLEHLRECVNMADPYLRQARRAAGQAHPPAEDVRQSLAEVTDEARDVGRVIGEHEALIDSALVHAEDLHRYATELEHLWQRLSE